MTRRQALQTMLAGTTLPAVTALAYRHEPPTGEETYEEGDAVSSLMAVLLDLSDEEFHAIDHAKRDLLMGALYEVLNRDHEAVTLWANSLATGDAQAMTDLHALLKARAQEWTKLLACGP